MAGTNPTQSSRTPVVLSYTTMALALKALQVFESTTDPRTQEAIADAKSELAAALTIMESPQVADKPLNR